MTAWASFYPWVLPHVRGCPQPLIDQALRDAARDFCSRSRAWEERAATVEADGTTSLLSFVFPTGAELVRVERVTIAGEDWEILNSESLPADWLESAPEEDLDDTLVVVSATQYQLVPTPSSGDDIILYQSLQPTITATGVGDVIFARWGEKVAAGARKRLKAMSGREWFDATGAQVAHDEFEAAVHSAANWKFRQSRNQRTGLSPL